MITADRETKQGGVFPYIHHNHSVGVLLELNCSTDFVAHSETFRKLASELALQIAGVSTTKYVKLDDVPAEVLAAERTAILEDPALERVPEGSRDDFISGKLKKSLGDRVLMLQPWVKDEAVTIEELVRKVIAETGENIVLRRFSRFALGE